MGKPKGYDPTLIKVLLGGIQMTDFGEDSMVKVTRTSDLRSATVGADGNVTVNKSADRTGTMEITLMHNSASNAILKALSASDAGFPAVVVDLNFAGDLGTVTTFAFVKNIPDFERAAKVGECTWQIILTDVDTVFSALENV